MTSKPTVNNRGEYTNCAFHTVTPSGRGECVALTYWYNGKDAKQERCVGCLFFKTQGRVDRDAEKTIRRLSTVERRAQ